MDMQKFQDEVGVWLLNCFGQEISDNPRQRCQRFLEEALELFQSLDMEKDDALVLVDYVFSRPKGKPEQELGGVMTTAAALADRLGMDMNWDARQELRRIQDPKMMEKIRKKQNAKNNTLGISDTAN